jgi:hypothetical protein
MHNIGSLYKQSSLFSKKLIIFKTLSTEGLLIGLAEQPGTQTVTDILEK